MNAPIAAIKPPEVKLGVRRAGKVEVVDGLVAGETVVVAGQQRLQSDGSPVRIVNLGKPAGKASAASPSASAVADGAPAAPAASASR
mgnify:CR=1 FL=1